MNSITTGGLVKLLHTYFMCVMMAASHSNEAEKMFAPVKYLVCTGTQQLQMPFQNSLAGMHVPLCSASANLNELS